jgi:cytidine deaminase
MSAFEYIKHRALIAYRKETYSYRGFKVGCAVLAHNGETVRAYFRTAVFSEGNLKKRSHDIKLCAERRSILKAQRAGYPNIAGMVIVGKCQADQDSLLVTPTLHSCLACRMFFMSTPGITNQTIIVTFEPDEEIMEVMTVEELLKLHKTI